MSTPALQRVKALSAAENRIIGMIASGIPLSEVLDELCRTIDSLTPGVVSTVLLMDPDGKRLWPGGGPHFPAALKPAITPWAIGPGRGACGMAAFLKDRVIIADVTSDPRWPDEYREVAIRHGLRASWSQPLITNAGTVLGTFAMYYAEPRVPEAADLELIDAASQIALIAIQLDRSQAALRESEGRFRLVVNTIPVMIWSSDDQRQRTYLNHAWSEFAGSAPQSQSARWADNIHPEDASRAVEAYTAAFGRRVPFETEYRLRRNDGAYRWIFDQAVPRLNSDGSFSGYFGSAIDITERKLAEEALSMVSRRLIEAQEAERTRLARELHDDINQRLGLVSISLDRLKSGVTDAELREGIREANGQVGDIARSIHALSHRLHSSKLDLLGLTRAAASLCAELADLHSVVIAFGAQEMAAQLPQDVSLCLFRVLQEALQNAIKHSGSREITVSLKGGARDVELIVIDAGVGFDGREARGRGLGLTSMAERLKLVEGELFVHSELGRGTTVRARIPLDRHGHGTHENEKTRDASALPAWSPVQ